MHNIFEWFKTISISDQTQKPAFLFILGAQKSGTSTLFHLLRAIPGFCSTALKEVGYFSKDFYYKNGKTWYLGLFNEYKKGDIRFEATPEYLYYPFVPQRIFKFGLPARFIVMLREPAARCYSAWNMFRNLNKQRPEIIYKKFTKHGSIEMSEPIKNLIFLKSFPSFEEAVLKEIDLILDKSADLEPSFVRRGLYYRQLLNYLKFFKITDFLFIEQMEFTHPDKVVHDVCRFLEINLTEPEEINMKVNVGRYSDMTNNNVSAVITRLKEFYRPHNEDLFKLIGKRFPWND